MKLKKYKKPVYPSVQIFHDINWRYDCPGRRPEGGSTTVYLLLADGVAVAGQARCSPKDQYDRRVGRSIAYGRALRAVMLLWGSPRLIHKWAGPYMGRLNEMLVTQALYGQKID